MTESVVEFDHVCAMLQDRTVLEDINFSVLQGSFVGIIGPNGAGKTTLLRLALGLLAPTEGRVKIFGREPCRLRGRERRVGYLPQKPKFDRRFPVNVSDVVMMGLIRERGFFQLPGRQDKRAALGIMENIGISHLRERPIGELSGGQQQLAFLASALVSKPMLLILDEPTTGLDPSAQYNFYRLVKKLQGEMGLTVIAVSHDLAAIAANSDKLICINKTMHIHGSPGEVMEKLTGGRHYKCEYDILFGPDGWRNML